MATSNHIKYMLLALELAARGQQTVSPNPMVGCVIVNHEEIVGKGYHQRAGGPHAEIHALHDAGSAAKEATAYVTLEPCCHHGRTPPCTNALIQAGVRKVYVACLDPNPLMRGKGVAQLREAGIDVEVGLAETEAKKINEVFFHYITQERPFVIAKWAMSLDGKTTTHENDTRFISGEEAREQTYSLRRSVDAVLIGGQTARLDNPKLLASPQNNQADYRHPLRIVVTNRGLPSHLEIFNAKLPSKTIVVTSEIASCDYGPHVEVLRLPQNAEGRIDFKLLLDRLAKREITSLLIEGGMTTHQQFFTQNLVNTAHVYLSPVIIGSLTKKQTINHVQYTTLGRDLHLVANYKDKENNHV